MTFPFPLSTTVYTSIVVVKLPFFISYLFTSTCSTFLIDRYAINTPIIESVIGIAIIELNENSPLLEHKIDTINIADTIVAGTDFFLIPKYRGISPIPAEDKALTTILIKVFITNGLVSLSGIKL